MYERAKELCDKLSGDREAGEAGPASEVILDDVSHDDQGREQFCKGKFIRT